MPKARHMYVQKVIYHNKAFTNIWSLPVHMSQKQDFLVTAQLSENFFKISFSYSKDADSVEKASIKENNMSLR